MRQEEMRIIIRVFFNSIKTFNESFSEMRFVFRVICVAACDIATKASVYKVADKYKVPIILYGNTPLEEDSFILDDI